MLLFHSILFHVYYFFYCKMFVWISEGFMLFNAIYSWYVSNAGDTHIATTERSMKNDIPDIASTYNRITTKKKQLHDNVCIRVNIGRWNYILYYIRLFKYLHNLRYSA